MKRLFLALLVAMAAPLAAQTAAPADTPGRTAAGVSYTLPKDWTATTRGQVVVFAAPQDDLRVAVVDVGAAADAQAATTRAWALFEPDARRTVRLATAAPAREGWDERVTIAYETSPNERRAVQALALRKDRHWTVMIVDGAEAAFGRRLAAAGLLQQSLRPAGYERESFSGRTAHRLTPERVELIRAFVAEAAETLGVP